ncbi:hypothetical protein L204_102618 [Cryptococcus depauperatus]
MPSPALPGLFFCFAAVVLLIFVSVSPPVWDKVNFLHVTAHSQKTVFGVFGECIQGGNCTKRAVGYNLVVYGAQNVNINDKGFHSLTKALILHPIAGLLALIALLFGLMGVGCASRGATIMMALTSAVAFLVTLVVFVIDIVMWVIIRHRVRNAGYDAHLGNANWLTIGAVGALFLATCTSVCGSCGRFARGRMAGEKVSRLDALWR